MKKVILFIALLVLAGCSSYVGGKKVVTELVPYSQLPQTKENKALIVIFREWAFSNSGTTPEVLKGAESIGYIRNGSYFYHWSDPGTYTFSLKVEGKPLVKLTLENQKKYYLLTSVQWPHFLLMETEEDFSLPIIEKLKRAKFKNPSNNK